MSNEGMKPISTWEQDSGFLPEDYVKGKAERRANLLIISLFAVMVVVIVGVSFLNYKRGLLVREEKNSINTLFVQEAGKIDEVKALEQQQEELIKKGEITAALNERVPRSLIFAEILKRMPRDQNMALQEFELESEVIKKAAAPKNPKSAGIRTLSGAGGKTVAGQEKKDEESLVPEYRQTLTMVGVGSNNDNIADYIESLKNCAILTGVELQYIKSTTIDEAELRKFEIRAKIRRGIDARALVDAENPEELPEVGDVEDFTPAPEIFLQPTQVDDEGAPVRIEPETPEIDPSTTPAFDDEPLTTVESALGMFDGIGGRAKKFLNPPNPDRPWESVPASPEEDAAADSEPASEEADPAADTTDATAEKPAAETTDKAGPPIVIQMDPGASDAADSDNENNDNEDAEPTDGPSLDEEG